MNRKILIIGESYMNLEIMTDPMKKTGNVTEAGKYSFHPYGKTSAAAITTAKMGSACVLATKLADDMNGERLTKYYKACGVDSRLFSTEVHTQTGFSVTTYDGSGTCEHYVSKGANAFFSKKTVDEAFGTFPDFFLVPQDNLSCTDDPSETSSAPAVTICDNVSDADEPTEISNVTDPRGRNTLALYACNKAMEKKIEMIVDYDSCASSLPLSEFTGIKALIISDEALYKMTGFYPSSDDRVTRSLVSLSSKIRSKYYIVLSGNNTSYVYDGNACEKVLAPSCMDELAKKSDPKMKETYIGAFIAEFLATKNVIRACKYANIVSLLSKTRDGVLERIPNKAEIEKYIADNHIDTKIW